MRINQMRGHVLPINTVTAWLAIQASSLLLEDHALNSSTHNLSCKGRPDRRCRNRVWAIDLYLSRGTHLIVKLKDLLGIIVKARFDIVNSELAISHCSEQQWQCVGDANSRIWRLLRGVCQLVWQATHREDVDNAHMLPKGFLVLGGGQDLGLRVVILAQEQCIDCNVTSDLEPFLLRESNQLDVVLSCDTGNMNLPAVEAGQEQN
jgi:hypothetical protein